MSEAQDSALAAITNLLNKELESEGITPELLEYVDLSVEYSPVLPFAGGEFGRDDAKVVPWGFPASDDELPELFEVKHGFVRNPVDRESLKIMRCRWLVARGKYYAPQIDRIRKQLQG